MIAAHPDRFPDPWNTAATDSMGVPASIWYSGAEMWPFRKRKDPDPEPEAESVDSGSKLHRVVIDAIQQVPGQY